MFIAQLSDELIRACIALPGRQNQAKYIEAYADSGSVRIVNGGTDCRNGEKHNFWNVQDIINSEKADNPVGAAKIAKKKTFWVVFCYFVPVFINKIGLFLCYALGAKKVVFYRFLDHIYFYVKGK